MKMKSKSEWRSFYLAKREQYSEDEIDFQSRTIVQQLFSASLIDFQKISCLHIYLPIKAKNEINTFLILEKLKADFPHIKIGLSISDFQNFEMHLVEYDEQIPITIKNYGIPEPIGGKPIMPSALDLVILPAVICDSLGNRIGYGKGFYDRFLRKCSSNCIKIGICLEEPIEKIEVEPNDVAIDILLTPKKVHFFTSL